MARPPHLEHPHPGATPQQFFFFFFFGRVVVLPACVPSMAILQGRKRSILVWSLFVWKRMDGKRWAGLEGARKGLWRAWSYNMGVDMREGVGVLTEKSTQHPEVASGHPLSQTMLER